MFEKQEIITSIEKKQQTYFDMFPNPVSDVLSFNVKPTRVEFYDVNGKLVKQHISGDTSVNISDLQNGIYTAKFFSEGNVFYKRLLKTN